MSQTVAKKTASYLILIAGALIVAFPFFWMLSTSLKTRDETGIIPQALLPESPQLKNYADAWNGAEGGGDIEFSAEDYQIRKATFAIGLSLVAILIPLFFLREIPRSKPALTRALPVILGCLAAVIAAGWQYTCLARSLISHESVGPQVVTFTTYFANSIFAAACVTAGVLFTSILAAYAFANINFPGKGVIFVCFLATMMIPFEVALVPNCMTIVKFGWQDTFPALIVPWMANVFSIFILRQFFRTIPRDYFDAARIDGCGHWRYMWRVAVPMATPALVTITIFTFLGSWNAFLWPMLVTESPEMRVVQHGLKLMTDENSSEFHLLMAAAAIVIIPVVVLYLILQRRFIEGVSGAGLKG